MFFLKQVYQQEAISVAEGHFQSRLSKHTLRLLLWLALHLLFRNSTRGITYMGLFLRACITANSE